MNLASFAIKNNILTRKPFTTFCSVSTKTNGLEILMVKLGK